jgi:alkanesulfonate monooxygenase SsuD/methylene tetrahydromethanopterin reductase-like flavin-dependent oxidoreductase (luciferase family)
VFWLLDHHPETGESLASVHATALDHARLADELGFRGLWLAEHHFRTLGTAPNPAVLLAAVAQRTEKIRLGPAVAVLPLRDPVLVAEDYALVDGLSKGRLDMGVGTGSNPLEFEGLGRDFERRHQAFDRHLRVLCERWSAAAAGELGPKSLNVAPVQSPRPPIYVAAMHAESAHGVGLGGHGLLTLASPLTLDLGEIASRLEAHARGLAEGGHSAGSADAVVAVFAHVGPSDEEARAVGAPAMARVIRAMVGAAPDDPLDLYERMRERDIGLFGGCEHVARQIERYAEAGVGHIAFISRFGAMGTAASEQSLRLLAPGR